ncbi:MAG: hypothetical protein ACTH80_04485 [Alkalibacterium gilvum]|uniref:hypothetical protein n=1 Tax=Alkalibacterium gilvum TaxID=1130080 RepID=UPI003F8FDBF4
MKKNVWKILVNTTFVVTLFLLSTQPAFASNGTDKLDSIAVDFLQPWLIRIGMLLAVFGAGALILSIIQDNPQSKSMGVKFLSGGLMLAFGLPFFMTLIGF